MLISTNYERKDWISFSLRLLLQLVLPFLGILFILFTLFIPMVDIMKEFIPIIIQEDLVIEIRDVMRDNGFNDHSWQLYYTFTIAGGILIPIIILLWSMSRLLDLGNWWAEKIELKDPQVFWDGVPTKETKWGKRVIAFDNIGKKSKHK